MASPSPIATLVTVDEGGLGERSFAPVRDPSAGPGTNECFRTGIHFVVNRSNLPHP
jgi:hypothetical protein